MSEVDALMNACKQLNINLRKFPLVERKALIKQAGEVEAAAIQLITTVFDLIEAAMREGALTLDEQQHLGHDHLPGQPTNPNEDWRFTGGLSTWRDIGEWLTANHGWIRHPSGVGKRQFYRPPPEDTGE